MNDMLFDFTGDEQSYFWAFQKIVLNSSKTIADLNSHIRLLELNLDSLDEIKKLTIYNNYLYELFKYNFFKEDLFKHKLFQELKSTKLTVQFIKSYFHKLTTSDQQLIFNDFSQLKPKNLYYIIEKINEVYILSNYSCYTSILDLDFKRKIISLQHVNAKEITILFN